MIFNKFPLQKYFRTILSFARYLINEIQSENKNKQKNDDEKLNEQSGINNNNTEDVSVSVTRWARSIKSSEYLLSMSID